MDAPLLARRLTSLGFETEVRYGSQVVVIHGHKQNEDGLHRIRREVRSIAPGAREIGHAVAHATRPGGEETSLVRFDCSGHGGPRSAGGGL